MRLECPLHKIVVADRGAAGGDEEVGAARLLGHVAQRGFFVAGDAEALRAALDRVPRAVDPNTVTAIRDAMSNEAVALRHLAAGHEPARHLT